MNCITIEQLNKCAADPKAMVSAGEEAYARELEAAAEKIFSEREQRPVVLVSGPSGSGKTTSANRIARLLKDMGCGAHSISMDNYFKTLTPEENALAERGEFDFESPMRLDCDLFREHLEKLSRCEEIDIPTFDFAIQQSKPGMKLKINRGDIVILEGIHALNPLVTGDSESYTNCVYVSVRTRIEAANGDLLHPSKIRLMRRLIRDKLYRGRTLAETFEFFRSVERGENMYIMPFKYRADFDIDTFIPYEPLIYRDILLDDLAKAALEYENYSDYADIERFLKELSAVDRSLIPENSLIREFVG
ncbi:MAG: nucleoside kinase [Ruminococcaceae bacterium]|nr:nucleoside kinase [Oscillospiraceae bacterium]